MTFRLLPLLALAATPASAKPRLPADAPYCAGPAVKPLFFSPMGEPFHAERGEPYPSRAWFTGADADHDGRVDRAEMVRDADRFFRKLDLDHDGRLTPDEVIAYERDVAPEIALYTRGGSRLRPPGDGGNQSQRPRAGESGYSGPMGAGRYSWLNVPQPVASADFDVDRIVTAKEFAVAAGRRFDILRGTNDALTLAAMVATPQQAAIEGPCRPMPKPRRDRDRDDDDRDGPDLPRRDGGEPR